MCNNEECKVKCFDETCGKWINNTCDFIAFGDTKTNCTKLCTIKDNCNYKMCKEICDTCTNKENCPWYKKLTNIKNILIKQQLPTDIDQGIPLQSVINVTVKENSIVTIECPIPFLVINNINNIDNKVTINTNKLDPDINHFMYTINKTRDKNFGVRIGTYFFTSDDKQKRLDFNENEEEEEDNEEKEEKDIPIIKFDVKNLDPDDFYDISLRAFNSTTNKISKSSNIFTIKPNKTSKGTPKQIGDSLIIDKNNSKLKTDLEPEICNK